MRDIYAPTTRFIKDISERLETLKMPIYYKLPSADVPEPFIVIGGHTSTDGRTAKIGKRIEDTTLRVDIFLPANSRTEAEETRYKAVSAIGRRTGVDSDLLMDNTIGRETYHIPIRISDIIL